MNTTKMFGKISSVKFGLGGYQDCCIGIHFTLMGSNWCTTAATSAWDANLIKHSEGCKWTEEGRDKEYADIMRYVSGLLKDAKVDSISGLKGVPVEATFDGNLLVSWRILTEVL